MSSSNLLSEELLELNEALAQSSIASDYLIEKQVLHWPLHNGESCLLKDLIKSERKQIIIDKSFNSLQIVKLKILYNYLDFIQTNTEPFRYLKYLPENLEFFRCSNEKITIRFLDPLSHQKKAKALLKDNAYPNDVIYNFKKPYSMNEDVFSILYEILKRLNIRLDDVSNHRLSRERIDNPNRRKSAVKKMQKNIITILTLTEKVHGAVEVEFL